MLLPDFLGAGRQPLPQSAPITASAGGVVSVSGAEELQNLPLFAPYGVCGVPVEGETALVLPLEEGGACVGVLCPSTQLHAGELLLYSVGGAQLILRQNGEISLNGLVITKDGTLQKGGGAV